MRPRADNAEGGLQPPRRLSRGWRYMLSGLLGATVGGAAMYSLLGVAGLKQTSALFIGLPLLLGLLTIHLTHAAGPYGQVLRANAIGLAVVAPLLGEGSICLLMAAPLFVGVSMLVVVVYNAVRRPRTLLCFVMLPVLLGVAEKHSKRFTPGAEIVTTTVELCDAAESWRATVRDVVPVSKPAAFFLQAGLPLPDTYVAHGDEVVVRFRSGARPAGLWRARRRLTPDGVAFEMIADTTKIGTWIRILESRVAVQETPNGAVLLTQTTRFIPLLFPMWYFVPVERYTVAQAHAFAFAMWQAAREGQAHPILRADEPCRFSNSSSNM